MIIILVRNINLIASGYSFVKGTVTRKAEIYGMPVTLGVELTNHCNLKCPECSSGSGTMTRSKGFMDLSLFGKIVDELQPYLIELSLYFQGESMLHPHLGSFLEKAERIRTTLATNGHFLSPGNSEMLARSGLNKLIVSLDGMDQETYSAYRINGDLSVVMEGIANISSAIKKNSSKLKLVIQFLVNSKNEHQIPDARRYAREMNASFKLKSMQIINEDAYEKWLPSKNEFRRYELKNNKYIIRSRLPDNCYRMWFNPVVTWDGKVVPCCFDKNADHVMGDLNKKSFREIWHGQPYRSFRESVMNDRKRIDICRNCTSGLFRRIIS